MTTVSRYERRSPLNCIAGVIKGIPDGPGIQYRLASSVGAEPMRRPYPMRYFVKRDSATRTLSEFGREPLLLILKFQLNVGHPPKSDGVLDVYLARALLVAAAAESKTNLPPRIVLRTLVSRIFSGAMERISSLRSTISASLPGVMEPFSFS